MFEDATFDARGAVRNGASRWMMLTAVVNAVVVAGLVIAPLFVSRTLPAFVSAMNLPRYIPRDEPAKIEPRISHLTLARPVTLLPIYNLPPRIAARPRGAEPAPDAGELVDPVGTAHSGSTWAPDGISVFRGGSTAVVKEETPRVARVSGGVAEGLLLTRVTPVYPVIARSARVEGEVVLAATISAAGNVENLRVIRGNAMLREAAIDAVRGWRYRPYLLSGKPVEVETTITIRFSLQGR